MYNCHKHRWNDTELCPICVEEGEESFRKDESIPLSTIKEQLLTNMVTYLKDKNVELITELFYIHTSKWKSEIMHKSTGMWNHDSYKRIIKMGSVALPLIFQDLKINGPNHWFQALREITGENPVKYEDKGHMQKMTDAWLSWGEKYYGKD